MKVYRKGMYVKSHLEAQIAKYSDLRKYAWEYTKQVQLKGLGFQLATAEYDGEGLKIDYFPDVPSPAQEQVRELFRKEGVLERLKAVAKRVKLAKQWLPFVYIDDLVELDFDDLEIFGFGEQ